MKERIALSLSYNGAAYYGWQRQLEQLTVQGALEQAIFKMSGENVNVVCAGRTDKGVHALNQVIHFDIEKQREPQVWINGLNAHLPRDIRVHSAQKVSEIFHARFSAYERHYRYFVLNQRIPSPIFSDTIAWYPYELDLALMQQAAECLIGEHDFSAFRSAQCQAKSPIRTVLELNIQQKNQLFIFDIKANAFLHHMVRNIVGSLFCVGRQKFASQKVTPQWMQQVLVSKDRAQAGVMAPAQGLYFMEVCYQNDVKPQGFNPKNDRVNEIYEFFS